MGTFKYSGGVEIMGFISPTDPSDQYPVIDPLYGIDGFRNVNTLSDLDDIPEPRRRAGMVVGVSGGTSYYKLNTPPWLFDFTDWSVFNSGGSDSGNYLPLSGGTITGQVIFSGSSPNKEYITFFKGANTGAKLGIGVSGNLSDGITNDILNSGGTGYGKFTLNSSEIINNIIDSSGGTVMSNAFKISQSGDTTIGGYVNFTTEPNINNTNLYFLTRNDITGDIELRELSSIPDIYTDDFTFNNSTYELTIFLNDGNQYTQNLSILAQNTFVTGGTYDGSVITFTNNTGGTFTVTGITSSTTFTGGTVTGSTNFTNGLTANTISATTYQNLPTDIRVTGGTYSNGTTTFTNNTGGTFTVTGFLTGTTDTFTTGGTFNNNTKILSLNNNTGGTVNITGFTDIYVSGATFTGTTLTLSRSENQSNITATIPTLSLSGAMSSMTFNIATSGSFSAATYLGLPTDVRVTGGTYVGSTITFTNNTGGTFTVTGITSSTEFTGGTVTGSTNFTGGLSANTISATTYSNLPTDIRVTGGTYNNGVATFTNNTGGTFNVTGFFTSSNDTFVTGVTYSANTLTIKRNQSQADLTSTIGLITKSNSVSSASFTGSPKKYTVSFTTPHLTTNYGIIITGSDNRVFTYESKTVNGFIINTNANTALTGNVDWLTTSIGES